jgi:hypothetical protein
MNWHDQMEAAIKKRTKGLAAIARWQEQVNEAEAEMASLSARQYALTQVTQDEPVAKEPAPVAVSQFQQGE